MFKPDYLVEFDQRSDGSLLPTVSVNTRSLEKRLEALLPFYWRWVVEGRKKYAGSYHRPEEQVQYFYDNYHDSLYYNEDTGNYHYSLQLSDGPDGDEWATGVFKIEPGTGVVLLTKTKEVR